MMNRVPEPELMDLPEEALAYAHADFSEVNQRFFARLMEQAGDRETCRIVDLGCGPGDIAIAIGLAMPKWDVIAVDASRAMLIIAEAKKARCNARNVSFIFADAKNIPLPIGRFDWIVSNSLLHHLPDPRQFWANLVQLAGSQGQLFLRDLCRPDSIEQANKIVTLYAGKESTLLQQEFHRSLLAAFTVDETREQLHLANLKQLKVEISSDRHFDVTGLIHSFS